MLKSSFKTKFIFSKTHSLLFVLGILFGGTAFGQILIDESNNSPAQNRPKVGKGAAADYFKARSDKREMSKADKGDDDHVKRRPDSSHGDDRYLTIHMGTFVSDKAYRWGANSSDTNVGSGMFGVTYRMGEWKSSMDLLLRAEFLSYSIDREHPLKLGFMPIVAFPDSRSDFPVYFGAGAGVGIFFKQIDGASPLSIDYAVLMGARFPYIFGNSGFFVETGLKGQFFLLSEGQQQGVYLIAGGAFVF